MEIKYPKGETVWVTYYSPDHRLCHIVTTKPSSEYYFLYKYENDKFTRISKAKSPLDFENKFSLYE